MSVRKEIIVVVTIKINIINRGTTSRVVVVVVASLFTCRYGHGPTTHRGKHRYYFNKLNLAIRSSVGGGSIDDVADLKEVIVLCE